MKYFKWTFKLSTKEKAKLNKQLDFGNIILKKCLLFTPN